MTFILKENSPEIRKKIEEAGIRVCVCASFVGSCWLEYATDVANGVHGVGYPDEDRTSEDAMAEFLYFLDDGYYCHDVEEFIDKIKKSKKE